MQLAIGLYPELTALDFVGPYQVFSAVPGIDVVLVGAERGTLADDNGLLRIDI